MKLPLAIAAVLVFISGRAIADELLNPPNSPDALLNGKVGIASPGGFPPWAGNFDIGRYEEEAIFTGGYARSGAASFWGSASVPVWRGDGIRSVGSAALLGALRKGPGGVPVLQVGAFRGTSGLVIRSH